MADDYAHAGVEPALVELFSDPIVRAVMRRDGVDDDALCRAIAIGRFRLGLSQTMTTPTCAEWLLTMPSEQPCGCTNYA